MADRQKIKSIFDQLKHDPNHHLGLGDIRLTIGQQDEIINLFPETTPPQNTISSDRQKAEETYQKMGEWLNSKGYDLDLDEDGFWFEDYISEHKWKDIFDLMLDFHAQQVEAAPDMLDALQNLENDDNSIPEHAWKLVKDVIAKATAAS